MMDEDLKQYLEGMEGRMEARMETMETRLLTEFHRWAQTYEIRARGTTWAAGDFEARVARLERGANGG